MWPRISIPLAIAAFLSTAAVAGCGGGPEQLSATELVQRGDEICSNERDRFNEVQAEPPASPFVAADQTKDLIEATEGANSDLRDLEPPEDLQPTYDRYLDTRDGATDQMKRGENAAENQDSDAYGAAQEAVARSAPERERLARRLGFKVCSEKPQHP